MTDCTVPRHDTQDEPTPAIVNGHLCQSCARQLRTDLQRIPSLHISLEDALASHTNSNSTYGRISRNLNGLDDSHNAGLPFNDAVSERRSQIEHDLRYWAHQAAEDRRATLPQIPPSIRVTFLCGWLYASMKWIPYRPWAPHMADTFAQNARGSWALLQPRLVKTINWMDPCPHCETLRELQATIHATDGDPRPSTIECLTCRQTWTSGIAWLELARQVHTLTKTATA
jgi:hypothetical protein